MNDRELIAAIRRIISARVRHARGDDRLGDVLVGRYDQIAGLVSRHPASSAKDSAESNADRARRIWNERGDADRLAVSNFVIAHNHASHDQLSEHAVSDVIKAIDITGPETR